MGRKLIFLLPAALFAVLVIAFAVGLRHDPHLVPSALIDRPAPDFALPGLYESANGLTRNDLDRRVTLVNFFASWCAPCREEHSELMALGRLPGVTLDGIAYKDKPEESRRFLDRLGNPFGHTGVDRNGRTAIDFGVYGVPETYVVDGTGHIRYRHVGPLTAADVKSEILPLIQQLGRAE
jgi:cytochrome c biogenesis protein CcmG, thiol:disulfide interchange protein DsbE